MPSGIVEKNLGKVTAYGFTKEENKYRI